MIDVPIYIPRPHAGQQAMLDSPARRKVAMCGRRVGKTECGIIRTCEVVIFEEGSKVGWFVPDYKRFTEVWEELIRVLGPMVETANKTEKRIVLCNGSSIDCWSLDSKTDPGRSRGYRLVIVDEAGLVAGLEDLWRTAIRPCLLDWGPTAEAWFLGTPKASGRGFNRFFAYAESGVDSEWAAFRLATWQNPYLPGIVAELAKEKAQAEAAGVLWQYEQEYEGICHESETGFFGDRLIQRLIDRDARPPVWRGDISVPWELRSEWDVLIEKRDASRFRMEENETGGKLRLWVPPSRVKDRPHGIACDLSYGMGSSNTVMSIGDCWSREKIGEWVSSSVEPRDAARVACSLALWFGSARVNFEANGAAGETFAAGMRTLRYGNVYQRVKLPKDSMASGSYDAMGWWSDDETKETALGMYRADLAQGRFTNHSREALLECLLYHHDVNDRRKLRVRHERELADSIGDEARMPHGDRPIADMLLAMLFNETPPPMVSEPLAPVGSVAWDMQEERRKRDRDRYDDPKETEW